MSRSDPEREGLRMTCSPYLRGIRHPASFLIFLSLVFGPGSLGTVHAQGLPDIKLSGVTSVDRAAAGSKFEAAVVMEIPAPFHVNAHKPSEDYLVPTTLTLQPARGLTLGPVVYPTPESKTFPFSQKPLLVHEGRLVLRVPVTVART